MVEALISIKYLGHLVIALKLSSLITFIVDPLLALMAVGSHSHMQAHRILSIVIIVSKGRLSWILSIFSTDHTSELSTLLIQLPLITGVIVA